MNCRLFFLSFFLFLFSCNKKPTETKAEVTYELSTFSEVLIIDELTFNYINIIRKDFIKEEVSISAIEVPKEMTIEIRENKGTPPFSTMLVIKTQETIKPATYPLKFSITNKNGDISIAKINVRVEPFMYLVAVSDRPEKKLIVPINTVSYASYSISYNGGFKQKVSMSALNIPSGVYAKFIGSAERPNYQAVLEINTNGASKGVYPIKIQSQNALGEHKIQDVDLYIVDECASSMQGYYGKSSKSIDGGLAVSAGYPLYAGGGGSANKMYIDRAGELFGFILHCDKQTVEIERPWTYMTSDTIISGSGHYTLSPKKLTLNCIAKTPAGKTYTVDYILEQ